METSRPTVGVRLGHVAPGHSTSALGACMRVMPRLPRAFAALAPFYGIPDGSKVDLAAIKVPVLGHFANTDGWCTPELVSGLETKLKGVGMKVGFHRYDAQHAFANEQRPDVYSKKDAETAFARTLEFFRAALK